MNNFNTPTLEDIGNLSLLENNTLKILKQLEYVCNKAKLFNPKSKLVTITFGDINFSFIKKVDLYYMALNLRKDGLNFFITYDLNNDEPYEDVYYGHAESEGEVKIGEIKGKNINDIEIKIKQLIKKLSSEKEKKSIKETKKNKNIIDVKNGGQICINGTLSEVKLSPKISNLLKKLIVLDKNGNYPLVKTKGLENKKKRNNDTLRTTLARLRKDTEELFEIKNVKNENDESCYTIIFKD